MPITFLLARAIAQSPRFQLGIFSHFSLELTYKGLFLHYAEGDTKDMTNYRLFLLPYVGEGGKVQSQHNYMYTLLL